MRTTIDLRDDLRARILALAAERRLRGFSQIVEEAIERYLDAEADADRDRRVAAALAALGSLPPRSAEAMRRRVRRLRKRWRS